MNLIVKKRKYIYLSLAITLNLAFSGCSTIHITPVEPSQVSNLNYEKEDISYTSSADLSKNYTTVVKWMSEMTEKERYELNKEVVDAQDTRDGWLLFAMFMTLGSSNFNTFQNAYAGPDRLYAHRHAFLSKKSESEIFCYLNGLAEPINDNRFDINSERTYDVLYECKKGYLHIFTPITKRNEYGQKISNFEEEVAGNIMLNSKLAIKVKHK